MVACQESTDTEMSQADTPSVSVIIPVYNGAAFVELTILSASRQTHENLEIIVVDDGSTDATPDILRELASRMDNLRVITIPNGGVANARNVGTRASAADYVAYLDADDLWHPTKIARQVAALERHKGDPDWAACYALFRTINTHGEVRGDGLVHDARGAIFPSHLVVNHVGNGSSLLVRREAALEVGGFDPSYAQNGIGGCEDRDFQLRLLRRYKMEVVREYLVGYRIYAGNMSSNRYAMSLGGNAVVEKFMADPRISREIRKLALATTYSNAVIRLSRGLHLRDAGAILGKAMIETPLAFFRIMLTRLGQFLEVAKKRIKTRLGLLPKPGQGDLRMFEDYDPTEAIAEGAPYAPSYRPVLDRNDAAYERRLSQVTPLPTPA
ncbi:glycosyltransferase family 2 protein [Mameliella alba]|uniref:glycosyltransferase family 2 protein n=2 Tax=Mameliella alba TaxID=561184 RepID=UPI0032E7FFA9